MFQKSLKKIPDFLASPYLKSFDGLRAISIIMVILAHIGLSYKWNEHYFHKIARLGVDFFFVISGFLITTLLLKEKIKKGTISLSKFYTRRVLRIVPIAYLYLSILLIANALFSLNLNMFSILLAFLFLKNFDKQRFGIDHLNTHYWSLAVEEQFYLFFPFLLKISSRAFFFLLLFFISFPILIDSLNFHPNGKLSYLTAFSYQFQSIAIGALISFLYFFSFLKFHKPQEKYINLINFSILAFILMLTFMDKNSKWHSTLNLLSMLSFAFLIVFNLNPNKSFLFEFLNKAKIKEIGILSYSMYIWQQPLTYSLSFLKKQSLFNDYLSNPITQASISISSLLAVAIVSYISYNYFEKKFLIFKERFKA